MKKDQIITDIRAAVTALNAALREADAENLSVKIKQEFHPMTDVKACTGNAPVTIQITQTISY